MPIEKEGQTYTNIYADISKRIKLGVEVDWKTISFGTHIAYFTEDNWKFYIGIYFLWFSIFLGVDW
jgi:hypothetical protein